MKQYDVFISYSRKDLSEVKAFKEMLEQRVPGIKIWFDLTGVESGEEFVEKIITAMDQSERVLFFLSDNALESPWTKKEVMYAYNTHKKLVPVLLRGAQLKGWFLFQFGNISHTDSTRPEQVDILVRDLGGKPSLGGQAFQPVRTDRNVCPPFPTCPSNDPTFKANWEKAQRGDAGALYEIGEGYYFGTAVKKDYAEAVKWYRKAAEQGHAAGQNSIGYMYYNGYGVAQDYAEAVKWYRMAAEQGLDGGQYHLGLMYDGGYGVAQDYAEAVKWYRKAAWQGNIFAQGKLKDLGESW